MQKIRRTVGKKISHEIEKINFSMVSTSCPEKTFGLSNLTWSSSVKANRVDRLDEITKIQKALIANIITNNKIFIFTSFENYTTNHQKFQHKKDFNNEIL